MNFDNLTRREFIKVTGLATAGIVLGQGCATVGFESKEDIANIKWDANPAIPVPKDGCYAGWHYDIVYPTYDASVLEKQGSSAEESVLDYYIRTFGVAPAVHSFSDRIIKGSYFPEGVCEVADSKGVIPLIRYYFKPDFENVAKGNYDKMLRKFAQGAKEFGKPFFFVPYPEVNISGAWKHVHPWAGGNGREFKKAWKHMHNILDGEGANDYAIWGLHLLGQGDKQSFNKFKIEDKYIDWMGFTTYNLESFHPGYCDPFSSIIQEGYWWAKHNYPTKPIALWELGTSDTSGQGRWIKNAYKDIKKLPRIKLVVYAEYDFGPPAERTDCTKISDRATQAYKKAISDPYFIGAE